MKNIITTAAYPFIPAELKLAHIASTYLPGDIYHRFMKLSGHQALYVSATDVHGIWIKHASITTQDSTDVIVEKWHQKYQSIFKSLHIHFDNYSRTDTQGTYSLVDHSLKKLRDMDYIYQKETDIYYCGSCHESLPKRFRLKNMNPSKTGKIQLSDTFECGFCQSTDIKINNAKHWFMKLNAGRETIQAFVNKQSLSHVHAQLNTFLNTELNEWNFTRNSDYYGLKMPFEDSEQRLYLWYDALLCYLSLIPETMRESNYTLRHFIGKNILYYHGIVWPYLLYNVFDHHPKDIQISARGFLNIEKSSSELVNIEEALNYFDPDFLRFYIAYKTPDNLTDYYFDSKEMHTLFRSILCNQIGSFFQRCYGIFKQYNVTHVPDVKFDSTLWRDTKEKISTLLSLSNSRAALLAIQKYIKECGLCITQLDIYRTFDREKIGLLAELMAGALLLLSIYMPKRVQDFDCFGLSYNSLEEASELQGRVIMPIVKRWETVL